MCFLLEVSVNWNICSSLYTRSIRLYVSSWQSIIRFSLICVEWCGLSFHKIFLIIDHIVNDGILCINVVVVWYFIYITAGSGLYILIFITWLFIVKEDTFCTHKQHAMWKIWSYCTIMYLISTCIVQLRFKQVTWECATPVIKCYRLS